MPGAYWRPASLAECLAGLSAFDPAASFIAGGTDLMVRHEHRLSELSLVDLSATPELSGISDCGDYLRVGATTSWSEIRRSELLARWAPLLPVAAAEVGGIQIQNRATIGGNIVNASPAADGLPVLYAYAATVVIASEAEVRQFPIAEFILAPGKTRLAPGALLTEIRVPKQQADGRLISFFEKVGSRKAQTIAKGSVAFHGWLKNGRLFDVRIALGSVAPTIVRATEAERLLERACTPDAVREAAELVSAAAKPIDDIRSTADYRRALVAGLLLRGLWKADPSFAAVDRG
jgi:CO/xanthine dehydrogenase FAD-binding subunit